MDGQLCEYTESQWTIYFTQVNCIIRELYLNKAVKNTKQIQRSYIKLLKSQNCYGSTTEPGGVFFLIPKSQDFDSGHLTHLWIFPPQHEERGGCLCACAALVKGWVLTMQRAEQSGLLDTSVNPLWSHRQPWQLYQVLYQDWGTRCDGAYSPNKPGIVEGLLLGMFPCSSVLIFSILGKDVNTSVQSSWNSSHTAIMMRFGGYSLWPQKRVLV